MDREGALPLFVCVEAVVNEWFCGIGSVEAAGPVPRDADVSVELKHLNARGLGLLAGETFPLGGRAEVGLARVSSPCSAVSSCPLVRFDRRPRGTELFGLVCLFARLVGEFVGLV